MSSLKMVLIFSQIFSFTIVQAKEVKTKKNNIVSLVPRKNIATELEVTPRMSASAPNLNIMSWQAPSQSQIIKISVNTKKTAEPPVLLAKEFSAKRFAISDVMSWQAPGLINTPEPQQDQTHQIPIKELTASEIKLIQSLLFLDQQKNPTLAFALLAELYNEKSDAKIKSEVTYHLARAAFQLGLNFESRRLLLEIISKKDSHLINASLDLLMSQATPHDTDLVEKIDTLVITNKRPLTSAQYLLNRARYGMNEGSLQLAKESLSQIDTKSELLSDSIFLNSLVDYKLGHVTDAISKLEQLLSDLKRNQPDGDMRSIVALTLARMHFQLGHYKPAFEAYLAVSQSHPEWPQAMIEQAWSQLLAEDPAGAAGNMFGLHSDFFKNSFVPESYAVRAAAYLHLCQYGHAAQVVKLMTSRYQPLKDKLATYEKVNAENSHLYETVKVFFRNREAKEIDGLPRSLVWSLARSSEFIHEQGQINSLEDQITKYGQISLDLIEQEKSVLAAQNKLNAELSESAGQKNKELTAQLREEMQTKLTSLKLQHSLLKGIRQAVKGIRTVGIGAMEQEKSARKIAAANALKKQFNSHLISLTNSLDQIEVLQYEIFSGAGEHLRFQASGGQIKPQDSKLLVNEKTENQKWDFQGEVWEDELGHYRSSLKNVCPQT